jgi:hypothetical protein
MTDELPDAAFLGAADLPGPIKDAPKRLPDWPLPVFCGTAYDQPARVVSRATLRYYFTSPGAPAESTPKSVVHQAILLYQPDAATAFMTGLRAAVDACKTQLDSGITVTNRLRGALSLGDDSALIEQTRPATEESGEPRNDGSLHSVFWTAVRVGNAVTFLSNAGWESCSADHTDTVSLTQHATQRLMTWHASL